MVIRPRTPATRVGAADFKATCLQRLDHLPPEGLIVTKHGKPVARVIPFEAAPTELIGSMAGQIHILGDIFTTGLNWEASEDGC